jgi:putative Holliday junction resolvase
MPSAAHKSPSAESRPGRILAIDYGQKRLGLAISDEMGLTARPLATLERVNRRDDLRRLREIVRKNDVRRIVVGQPLHLDGAQSEMAEEAARFAARIQKALGLPVELADERLSSWEAEQVMAETGTKKRGRGRRDQVAAAVILRDYLARAKAEA